MRLKVYYIQNNSKTLKNFIILPQFYLINLIWNFQQIKLLKTQPKCQPLHNLYQANKLHLLIWLYDAEHLSTF